MKCFNFIYNNKQIDENLVVGNFMKTGDPRLKRQQAKANRDIYSVVNSFLNERTNEGER